MNNEHGEILAILLNIKEQQGYKLDDRVVKQCYDLHKKHQYGDPPTSKIRELVEEALQASTKAQGS